MSELRIISLLPAATEIICSLGLESQLIGRSHECNFPESVKDLPVCSSSKFISGSDSAEIDRQVREILSDALSIYTIDKDQIRKLNPDVIITQSQCEVCAVSVKDVEEALEGLLNKECKVISLEPHVLSDVYQDIKNIANYFGVNSRADTLIELAEDRIGIIRHKLKFITEKPKVACIEWLSPLMVAGNWTPELVEIAGADPILAVNGKHSPFVDFDDILREDPDIMIVMPCGFPIQRTLQEINLLLELPGWADLKAVQDNRVYVADGNQYFNRSGPRLTDSIEILGEIIYPKQFVFGYEGMGWVKFNV